MYLRHSVRHKNGKAHTYWRLVRSMRRNGKVVQETVAQLGELDARGRARARDLARQIAGRGDRAELFEEPAGPEQRVAVHLDKVRLERGLRFGDVWLGWTLWKALRFDEVFARLIDQRRLELRGDYAGCGTTRTGRPARAPGECRGDLFMSPGQERIHRMAEMVAPSSS